MSNLPSSPSEKELERRRMTSRLMLWGGLGCLVLIIVLMTLVVIFFDLIVKLLKT